MASAPERLRTTKRSWTNLILLALLLPLGCTWRDNSNPFPAHEPARGVVDVICLQDCNPDNLVPDTLFGCLLSARKNGIGTVDLPPGVYLGHVADFIVGALKHYEIETHFERFYGYRIVLEFREAYPAEVEEAPGLTRMVAGSVGDVVVSSAGGPLWSVSPVLFLYSVISEQQSFERTRDAARAKGLPEPSREGFDVVVHRYGETYRALWRAVRGGDEQVGDLSGAYVVERCYLEKPEVGEIITLAKALK